MVHYKLMCFDVRGLGEVIRQLFYLGDVSFEDFRVSREEFKSLKSNLPSGQLPVLEIDGVMISQSASIGRFLARQYGYSGKTPTEEMQVDSIIDLFKDFMLTFRQFFFAVIHGYPEYEKERMKRDIVKPAIKNYFIALNKILLRSKSGFLVGDDLTWADLQIADNLSTLINIRLFAEKEPHLNVFIRKL